MRAHFSVFAWLILSSFITGAPLAAAEPVEEPPTAERALAKLEEGNKKFLADKELQALREKLAAGQHPSAVVLTCADSRVSPELIFQQTLGDIFVLRVAGNVADADILGSMEYAVEHLHVPLIVVLGHSKCGAVSAAVEKAPVEGNLAKLVAEVNVAPNPPADKAAALAASVAYNVQQSAKELTERSPVIKKAAAENHVKIVSGVYSLETGKVEWLPASAAALTK